MSGGELLRGGVVTVVTLIVEVMIGIWLLFLFALAVAWAPLERRFGSRDRRLERLPGDEVAHGDSAGQVAAYAVGATSEDGGDGNAGAYPTLAVQGTATSAAGAYHA